jgi:Ca-activated chloride channel family protein
MFAAQLRTAILASVWLVAAFQFPLKTDPRLQTDPRPDLRVDVPLVLIPAQVTTPRGTPVTTLNQENFRLFEDEAEQKITHFASEDAPLSIGLLFDASGSMRDKMRKSLEAATEFFKTSGSEDQFFLVEFNERPKLTVPFTRRSDEIYRRLLRTRPVGRTSLLDAIHLALLQMKDAPNPRKAIVILSDGGDNHSRYTESEIKGALQEADVLVYAMGIFKSGDPAKLPREERSGPRLLAELAEQTGGQNFPVENLDDLPGVCERIGAALHNQYLLGYYPANPARDGKYHRVKVVLQAPPNMPPLTVYHRLGYSARPQ